MTWQAVIDLDGQAAATLTQRLRELHLPPDVIERVGAAVLSHARPIACVTVLSPNADLAAARNFFVVETGAVSQSCLEVYVY